MKIQLASGVTIHMGKPYLNGSFYWIKRRVPQDLIEILGGRKHLQYSLQTKDPSEAFVRYAVERRRLDEIFKDARNAQKRSLPIASTISFLEAKYGTFDEHLEIYDSDELVHGSDLLVEELTDRAKTLALKHASEGVRGVNGQRLSVEQTYESIQPEVVATASELAYLRSIYSSGGGEYGRREVNQTLNDARELYLSLHPKGTLRSVLSQTNYAIDSFIDFLGTNAPLSKLSRPQIRGWIDQQLRSGLAPATVARRLNQFKAVMRVAASELGESQLETLVSKLGLPVAVRPVSPRYVPSIENYKSLLSLFKDDSLVLFTIFFGGRIGEVAGLKISDFKFDTPVPFVEIRANEVRGLKTETSERDFPLVGLALSAALELVTIAKSRSSKQDAPLLAGYDRDRGGDALSATLNKRLKKSGLPVTTHCFRHGLKDLLRRANVAEHLMDSIQGHGKSTVSRSYGLGYSLEQKAAALGAAYALIGVS